MHICTFQLFNNHQSQDLVKCFVVYTFVICSRDLKYEKKPVNRAYLWVHFQASIYGFQAVANELLWQRV